MVIVMTFLSAAIGIQVWIPPINVGTKVIQLDLINIGFYVAGLYVLSQTVQALTPPARQGFETLAYVGSWAALIGFTITLIVMSAQVGMNVGNIAELMRTSDPFKLVIALLVVAIIDLTLLQWLKNRGIARESFVGRDLVHGEPLHHAEVVRDGPVAVRGVPLIAHANNAIVIDARGQILDLDFTADGMPTHLRLEPVTPHAAGAA
jgi:hypothetical protein